MKNKDVLRSFILITLFFLVSLGCGGGGSSGETSVPPPETVVSVVLSDGDEGLRVVSVPEKIGLTVGHVTQLGIEVIGYHGPITLSAEPLIHTYINDKTQKYPGDTERLEISTLQSPAEQIRLQTLRTRPHPLTLTFSSGGSTVTVTMTVEPEVKPRTPLFGIHVPPYYDVIPEPFIQVWGPDCGQCPATPGDPDGTTRDILCAKSQSSCECHPYKMLFNPEADRKIKKQLTLMQNYASQLLRSIGGWGSVQTGPDEYLWEGLDRVFYGLSPEERDYSPLYTGIMNGDFGWMTCPEYINPDGSTGFYDPDNTFLMEQYRSFVRELNSRYRSELLFIETANEPCYGFYLCPCMDPGGPLCNALSGPNQSACEEGRNSGEFVKAYGPFLSASANAASEEMAASNPDAVLIAGALEETGSGLMATTRYMIQNGLLERENVAVMIHQFPYPYPNWLPDAPDCSYFQVPGNPYWLPAGCETAPPLEDYTTAGGRHVTAQEAWQRLDEAIDVSEILLDVEAIGPEFLNKFYLFDTELHAGFHDNFGEEPNHTTTPPGEALAGLRIGTINSHQRFIGMEFIFSPGDPAPYNIMVKHLAGATPVYRLDASLLNADYSGTVYKLFTRGPEDIIAIWSNAPSGQILNISSDEDAEFQSFRVTRFDADSREFISTETLSVPPQSISVKPVKEFIFISVISSSPGLKWLKDITVSDETNTDEGGLK